MGREPTWAAWLEALENNWTVAVRHDAASGGRTWMHSSSGPVLEFVRAREKDWRWWGEARAVRRPLCSLLALTPDDEFEVARPETGVALRLRCALTNTEAGTTTSPLAEFVRLEVDGQTVQTELVETKRANGEGLADRYHLWRSQALTPRQAHREGCGARPVARPRGIPDQDVSRSGVMVNAGRGSVFLARCRGGTSGALRGTAPP